ASVRLVAEARAAVDEAVLRLERDAVATDLAEARLLQAQVALLDADPAGARRAADAAHRAFVRQQRPAWAALAKYAGLRARWVGERRTRSVVSAAQQSAAELAAAG